MIVRNVVTFTSSEFNTKDPKQYFINPGCFGDDVARWLIGQLKGHGIEADDAPSQEDWGWYLTYRVNGQEHRLLLAFRPADSGGTGYWIGWVERAGALSALMGRRTTSIDPLAVSAVHHVLSSSPVVEHVRWHLQRDFDRGNEEAGQPSP
jgi:hypothetical protein